MNNLNGKKGCLNKTVDYIRAHYYDDISLNDLTRVAALNHSSLTKQFKDVMEVTPFEYLWQYRTDVAKRLLVLTDLPIKDISKKCGFKTTAHFSRRFESSTGCSPSDYRKNNIG